MPDADAVVARQQVAVASLARIAQSLAITTDVENERAASLLREIKSRQREIDEQRKSLTRPLDESKRGIMAMFQPVVDSLAAAETFAKAEMAKYVKVQRERLERERQEAEEERAYIEAQAMAAVDRGEYEEAAELQHERSQVLDPVKSRPAGTSSRDLWRGECTDKTRLLAAILRGQVPLEAVDVNQSALNRLAAATKVEGEYVPGLRFTTQISIAATGR